MENKKDKIIDGLSFSPQEIQVITELLKSPSYKEIVRGTTLSQATVAHYMSLLMKKTGTTSKEELVAFLRKMQKNDFPTSELTDTKKYPSKITYLLAGSLLIGVSVASIYIFKKSSMDVDASVNLSLIHI